MKVAILSISYLAFGIFKTVALFFILSRFRVLSRRDKERAKIAHSKDDDLAFHAHIKSFVSSSKFFNKLEENEHARHFYLESSVVKVIFKPQIACIEITKKVHQNFFVDNHNPDAETGRTFSKISA